LPTKGVTFDAATNFPSVDAKELIGSIASLDACQTGWLSGSELSSR
jgi:hypothetical protein